MLVILCCIGMAHPAVAPIAAVRKNFLSRQQQLLQLRPKDLDIEPRTTLKRTIVCNNPTCFYTNSNLIP